MSNLADNKIFNINKKSLYRSLENREPTILGDSFFSKYNMGIIQAGLKSEIKRLTNKDIGFQSEWEIFKIMRFVFLESRINDYTADLHTQILKLNTVTIKEAVKATVPDMLMFDKFQYDVLRNPVPMLPNPIFVSQKGNKIKKSFN